MSTGIPSREWWLIAAAALLILGAVTTVRLAVSADPAQRARAREVIGSAAQYGLLFGFAAVAAAISAHGLVGFARANMGLSGSWPYLLWAALDGAAGLCAVLLMRRAARGESALAPRLAVWGLVAASSLFNWTHAPDHPGAREAFALMPVIAATLFEFSLRETRHTAQHAERRLPALTWLRPAERLRVQAQLASGQHVSAEQATHQVRVDCAARRLYALRQSLTGREHADKPRALGAHRAHRAERRAQAALTRAHFADPGIAIEVLRHVQVLTLTHALAQLDYTTPEGPQAALASLITPGSPITPPTGPSAGTASLARPPRAATENIMHNGCRFPASFHGASPAAAAPALSNGRPGATSPRLPSLGSVAVFPTPQRGERVRDRADRSLVQAAARVVEDARACGDRLTQAALARQLRAEGFHIANDRLRWLAAASGLDPPVERKP